MNIEQAVDLLKKAGIEVHKSECYHITGSPSVWILGDNTEIFFADVQIISIAEAVKPTIIWLYSSAKSASIQSPNLKYVRRDL